MNRSTLRRIVRWLLPAAVAVVVAGSAIAKDVGSDSREVSDLLAQAKVQAFKLKVDSDYMESFTRMDLSWQSYAAKITEIKDDVNAVGKTLAKLNEVRSMGAPWQQEAIDRINPILREMAANVQSTIEHISKEEGRFLNTPEHKEYLEMNAELSTTMSNLVSEFVSYGKTKAKYHHLIDKLELTEHNK